MPRLPPSSVNRQSIQTSLQQMGNIKNKDASLRIKLADGKISIRSDSAQGKFKGFAINKQTLKNKTLSQQLDLVSFINTACKEAKLPVALDCRTISAKEGIAILSAIMDKHHENDRQSAVTSDLKETVRHKESDKHVAEIVNKEHDIAFLTQLREDVDNASIYNNDSVGIIDARIQALSPSSVDNNEKDRRADVTSTLEEAAGHKESGDYVADIVNKEDDIAFLTQLREDVANVSVYDDDAVDAIDARIQALSSSSLDATQPSTEADIAKEIKLENKKLASEIFNDLQIITENQIIPNQETLEITKERKGKFRYPTDPAIGKIPTKTAVRLPTSGDETSQRFHGNFVKLHSSEPLTIATQSPKPGAQGDFWLANFNNEAKAIVDLTQPQEGAKKVDIYYPTGSETLTFESGGETLQVSLKSQSIHPENSDIQRCEYIVVDSNGNEKQIDRIHYTGWVDHNGVEAQVLNQLIDTVDNVAGKDGAITVHCSAGVGRTGTFITARTAKHQLAGKAMDLAQIKKEIVDLGTQGRTQRNRVFIQKPEQMLTLVEFFKDLSESAPTKTPQTEEPIYQNVGDLANTSESIDQITPQPSTAPPRPKSMSTKQFWKRYDQHSSSASSPEKIWARVAQDMKKVAPSKHEKILNDFETKSPGTKLYLQQLLSKK